MVTFAGISSKQAQALELLKITIYQMLKWPVAQSDHASISIKGEGAVSTDSTNSYQLLSGSYPATALVLKGIR